jgi:WD40 repeat protein
MQILSGHKAIVRVLAFSPDGKLLASGGEDETIRLWQFPEGVEWDRLEGPPYVPPNLAFSPDGRWLAAPAPAAEAVWVWDTSNPSERRQLPLTGRGPDGHHFLDTVTFSPDGKRLLLSGLRGLGWHGEGYERTEALFRSWRVPTWEEAPSGDFVITSDIAWSRPCALSPGGAVLATTDFRANVMFWDTATGQELFQVTSRSGSAPAARAFSPDGRRFAAAWARTILTCDLTAQKVFANWNNPTPKHIQSLAFSPEGRTLATVSRDTTARLWDAATGRETAAYAWDIGPLHAVAFTADGMRAAVSGKKGTILVWDVE